MLIRGAELGGEGPLDVCIEADRITSIAPRLSPRPNEEVLEAHGGALLPGLHDHHIHLFALAAAEASLRCGPPEVRDLDALGTVLRTALPTANDQAPSGQGSGWLRGVGYHESVAGDLDRTVLDQFLANRPLRIQHRSGAMWVLNSAGIDRLRLDADCDRPGVERDARGRATGRLFRLDDWLREQLDPAPFRSLAALSQRLASYGVTGLTDATVHNGPAELEAFQRAIECNELRQHLMVMGSSDLPEPHHPRLRRGPVKILLDERELPSFAEVREQIVETHRRGRAVAIHCVTRTELVFASEAFREAGATSGDRIEHASVAPPDIVERLQTVPLTIVTQPHFIQERGDAYLRDVEPADRPWLYRCRGFLDAGIPLGAGTDAPFGHPDPWRVMRAAVERRTERGQSIGPDEALTPERALALFTSPPQAPGFRSRRLSVGQPADLCLLDQPWNRARTELSSRHVRATFRGGETIWSIPPTHE